MPSWSYLASWPIDGTSWDELGLYDVGAMPGSIKEKDGVKIAYFDNAKRRDMAVQYMNGKWHDAVALARVDLES